MREGVRLHRSVGSQFSLLTFGSATDSRDPLCPSTERSKLLLRSIQSDYPPRCQRPKYAAFFGHGYRTRTAAIPQNEKKPDRRSGLALGLGGVFGTPGDDRLKGQIVLVRGLAEVGVEAVIADGQRVVVGAGLLVLLLPDAAALDQLAARGAAEDAVRGGHRVRACDRFDRDVEVEGQG